MRGPLRVRRFSSGVQTQWNITEISGHGLGLVNDDG
jgi:hypothetical protein